MYIACLDLEGVLIPEIWIAFSEACGIPELRRTTRDEPDYEKLMNWRIGVLHEHGLGIREMQNVIAGIEPLPGARAFLDALRETAQTEYWLRLLTLTDDVDVRTGASLLSDCTELRRLLTAAASAAN